MSNQQKPLSSVRVNEKIKIIDEAIIAKLPKLKDKTLICSVIKKSGNRLFFQYVSPETGSGTLKVTSNPMCEVLGVENILTLSKFIIDYRDKNERPTVLVLNINGSLSTFDVDTRFWEQNPSNIKLKFLKKNMSLYSVPGSAIVNQMLNSKQ